MEWPSFLALLGTILVSYVTLVMLHAKYATEKAKKLYGQSASLVSGNDHMWKLDSSYNLCHLNSVWFVDGDLSAAEIAKLCEDRLMVTGDYDRLRQRLVYVSGLPFWVDAKGFRVENVVRDVGEETAPKTREALMEYIGELAADPFPVDRPLWQLQVIRKFSGQDQTVVVSRVHHVVGDGMGIVSMMFRLFEKISDEHSSNSSDSSDDNARKVMRKDTFGPNPLLTHLLVTLAAPWVLVKMAFRPADVNSLNKQELSGKRHVALSPLYDVNDVKAIKNHYKVTVNDTLMGMLGAAVHRFFASENTGNPEKGAKTPTTPEFIHLYVPVNMRTSRREPRLENKFAPVCVLLPVHTPDPAESMFAAKAIFDGMKFSIEPLVVYILAVLMASIYIPSWLGRFSIEFFAGKSTAVVTNVPGPQTPMSMGGRRIMETIFWVPARGTVGVGISLLSFGGKFQLGVMADELCMENPGKLVSLFDQVIGEMKNKVGVVGKEANGEESVSSVSSGVE